MLFHCIQQRVLFRFYLVSFYKEFLIETCGPNTPTHEQILKVKVRQKKVLSALKIMADMNNTNLSSLATV